MRFNNLFRLRVLLFCILLSIFGGGERLALSQGEGLCSVADFGGSMSPHQPRLSLTGTQTSLRSDHDTGTFRIIYTTSGSDGSSLEYAQAVAAIAEEALSIYTDIGWPSLPSDNGIASNPLNPDNLYDIFIADLPTHRGVSASIQGVTFSESFNPNTTYPDGRSSYIEIHKVAMAQGVISAENILRTTVAHEIHHALQCYYRQFPENNSLDPLRTYLWLYENTSVTMEDMVYDDVNMLALYWLPNIVNWDPLSHPRMPLDHTQMRYSGALWTTFLHEYYGFDNTAGGSVHVLRRIWEKIGTVTLTDYNYIPAIDDALQSHFGSDIATALRNYAIWRYFTGTRADVNNFFSEGYTYTTLQLDTGAPVGPGGANYIEISPPPNVSKVNFNGGSYPWGLSIIGHRTSGVAFSAELGLDANRDVIADVLTVGTDKIILVPVLIDATLSSQTPTYTQNVTSVTATTTLSTTFSGWRMVSVPQYRTNFSKSSIYRPSVPGVPGARSDAFAYTGSYTTTDPLSNGPGYWINFDPGSPATYDGTSFHIMWVPVNNNWNLIGSNFQTIQTSKVFTSHRDSIRSNFLTYNGASYDNASSLTPGNGYWIKLDIEDTDGFLTFNSLAPGSAPPPSSIDPNPPAAPPGPPAAPILTGTASGGHPSLSWNWASGLTYKLYRYDCEGASDCGGTGSLRYQGTGSSYLDASVDIGNKLDPGKVWYYVKATDIFNQTSSNSNKVSYWKDGLPEQQRTQIGSGTDESRMSIPTEYSLYPNFPNPFNPTTEIRYDLPEPSHVKIILYNDLGQHVMTLVDNDQGAGYQSVVVNLDALPSGVYIYRMHAGGFNDLKKMVLIK